MHRQDFDHFDYQYAKFEQNWCGSQVDLFAGGPDQYDNDRLLNMSMLCDSEEMKSSNEVTVS